MARFEFEINHCPVHNRTTDLNTGCECPQIHRCYGCERSDEPATPCVDCGRPSIDGFWCEECHASAEAETLAFIRRALAGTGEGATG